MKLLFTTILCASAMLFSSCGKTDGAMMTDSFIPDLSATWTATTNAKDNYFFLPVSTGAASSTFDGNETVTNNDNTQTQHSFSGSFTNSKITFTFNDGPKLGQKYSGTISGTAPNARMVLATPSGSITLQQHQ